MHRILELILKKNHRFPESIKVLHVSKAFAKSMEMLIFNLSSFNALYNLPRDFITG